GPSAWLAALAGKGVDYSCANPGTDFPPISESFARAAKAGTAVPKPILVPHENAAVAMAHGVYMISGRPQAVMVHTNVGTGNTINMLVNARRDHVPLVLLAGRSPISERAGVAGGPHPPTHSAPGEVVPASLVTHATRHG